MATTESASAPAHPGDALPGIASMLRALPVAIATARASAGTPLTLSFGQALGIDLRQGPAGVELVLRPAPGLVGAVEAELPRLVAALRAGGIRLARAEIRARRDSPPRRSAR